jgi:glycerol-3-phosphate acyltransferase PlsY
MRASGVTTGLIVAALDVAKGAASVLIAGRLADGPVAPALAGLAAIVGHIYPVWLKFRGGKGVATAFGALTGLYPPLGLGCLAVVVIAVAITRYVSFGSIFGALAAPVLSFFLIRPFLPYAAIMACIVIWRHRSNIVRLVHHEESKLSFHSAGKKEAEKDEAE